MKRCPCSTQPNAEQLPRARIVTQKPHKNAEVGQVRSGFFTAFVQVSSLRPMAHVTITSDCQDRTVRDPSVYCVMILILIWILVPEPGANCRHTNVSEKGSGLPRWNASHGEGNQHWPKSHCSARICQTCVEHFLVAITPLWIGGLLDVKLTERGTSSGGLGTDDAGRRMQGLLLWTTLHLSVKKRSSQIETTICNSRIVWDSREWLKIYIDKLLVSCHVWTLWPWFYCDRCIWQLKLQAFTSFHLGPCPPTAQRHPGQRWPQQPRWGCAVGWTWLNFLQFFHSMLHCSIGCHWSLVSFSYPQRYQGAPMRGIAERAGAGSSVALIVRTLACHCMAM